LESLLGRRVDLITAEGIKHIRIPHVRKEIEGRVIYVQEVDSLSHRISKT